MKLNLSYFRIILLFFISFIAGKNFGQGTFAPLTAPTNSNGGTAILLSDGSVIIKTESGGGDGIGNIWDKLTPSASGSYLNGTWSTIAPMSLTRLYFSSQVLKDGRVYVIGGEYGTGYGNKVGDVYNPLTNTWIQTPLPGNTVSDANSEILPDGRVLQALVDGNLRGNAIYDPLTNTYANGPQCLGIHNESAWMKLPDNSVLMVDRNSTNSERYIPSLNQWVADGNVPVSLYDPWGYETGSALLLPDGRAFFIGSLGFNAFYTPSGTASPGVWSAAATLPNNTGTPDAAMAMMVNGKILCAVSPAPTGPNNIFDPPTSFYIFDPVANTFTSINAPNNATNLFEPCYDVNMVDLPDGSVLMCQQDSNHYYVYTPVGSPQNAWRPVVNNIITNPNCLSFTITGTQFNGISEGASYGDDFQMNTNFPIVRLKNGSNVYYCRSFNWNSTGVQRGNAPDTATFTLPTGLPNATYQLEVVANGIASLPVSFTPCFPVGITRDPPDVMNLNVFPNPASDEVFVSFDSKVSEAYSILLVDVLGRRVKELNGNALPGKNSCRFDVKVLDRGIYSVLVQKGNVSFRSKLVLN